MNRCLFVVPLGCHLPIYMPRTLITHTPRKLLVVHYLGITDPLRKVLGPRGLVHSPWYLSIRCVLAKSIPLPLAIHGARLEVVIPLALCLSAALYMARVPRHLRSKKESASLLLVLTKWKARCRGWTIINVMGPPYTNFKLF